MTFLTLCQLCRQRAGMSGTGPAQVTGNTGEMARLVDWVRQAWLDLQSEHNGEWKPLWRMLEETIAADQESLATPEEMHHLVRDRLYFNDRPVTWHAWRDFPRRDVQGDHPTAITQRPDGMLMLWPSPGQDGTLHGEYYAKPQVLENDSDEPWLPRHLQDGIIYQALIYYAAYEDAPEVYQDANDHLLDYKLRMANELLPDMDVFGGPVA